MAGGDPGSGPPPARREERPGSMPGRSCRRVRVLASWASSPPTGPPEPWTPRSTTTRLDLQRVATHVLARRRHAISGRFGLRATPGGIGTPAFGSPDVLEVVRTAGTSLVHELGGQLRVVPMAGATLADLAALVDVDLSADFTVGKDTPDLGDVDAPLSARRRRGRRSVGLVRPRLASARHRRPHRGLPRTDPALAGALRRQLPARRSAPAPTIVATSVCRPATTTTRSRTCTWARG